MDKWIEQLVSDTTTHAESEARRERERQPLAQAALTAFRDLKEELKRVTDETNRAIDQQRFSAREESDGSLTLTPTQGGDGIKVHINEDLTIYSQRSGNFAPAERAEQQSFRLVKKGYPPTFTAKKKPTLLEHSVSLHEAAQRIAEPFFREVLGLDSR